MTYQCERCGQTALETDIVCWHCGWRFPRQEPKKPAARVKAIAAGEEPLSLPAVAIYATLILVTLVAIMLVTWSLDQKPFFLTNPEISLEPGWVPITDQEQQFTLNIPSQWQWFEQHAERPGGFDVVAGSDQFRAAVAPLADITADTEVMLVALSDDPAESLVLPGFLVVARSVDLKRLSAEQTLNLIRQRTNNVLNADVTERFTGQEQVSLLLDLDSAGSPFRCQGQLMQGPQAGYLVAGCTPQASYPRYRPQLEAMVATFQPLTR